MKELVVATNNRHKLEEIRSILGEEIKILSLRDVGLEIEIEETGETFYENAVIKAKTVAKLTGRACLADDSGLSVEVLNGKPGVYSARFAGQACDDKKNNEKLKELLKNSENRNAEFVSVIVVYYPNDQIVWAKGSVKGIILENERGEGGFGYDPLFYSTELQKTFAEASFAQKNRISHRARALEGIRAQLLD